MTDSLTNAFVFTSPEIEGLLADNHVDLVELLKNEQIDIQRKFEKNPAINADESFKEPTIVLLASAAIIISLTPTLTRAIAAITNRPIVVTEMVLIPVEDSSGNVIRDSSGSPVLQWIERVRVVERKDKSAVSDSFSIQGPMGFKITFGNQQ